jgi:hypothetical protein
MIRFGSLIEDLECYVDNTPYFADGCLVGRRGGIKRHLEREIPELYAHYKTVMRYKALSKKFRQAVGINDPIPADRLLVNNEKNVRNTPDIIHFQDQVYRDFNSERNLREKDKTDGNNSTKGSMVDWYVQDFCSDGNNTYRDEDDVENVKGADGVLTEVTERFKMLATEILAGCEGTVVSLAAQLEIRLNPDYTPRIMDTKSSCAMRTMNLSLLSG